MYISYIYIYIIYRISLGKTHWISFYHKICYYKNAKNLSALSIRKIHIRSNETYESYRTTFNVCTYARILHINEYICKCKYHRCEHSDFFDVSV